MFENPGTYFFFGMAVVGFTLAAVRTFQRSNRIRRESREAQERLRILLQEKRKQYRAKDD